jgi:hypothetical protein
MKKLIFALSVAVLFASCATLQSVVRSTFPYTSTLIIPASSSTNTTMSTSSSASSFDQIFTGQGTNTSQVTQVRMASAKIDAISPSEQSLGVFRSIKVYLVNGSNQTMVASRTNISSTAASSLVLDIDNSKFLDEYVKSGNLRVKVDYVLQNRLTVDLSIKATLGFNIPPTAQ